MALDCGILTYYALRDFFQFVCTVNGCCRRGLLTDARQGGYERGLHRDHAAAYPRTLCCIEGMGVTRINKRKCSTSGFQKHFQALNNTGDSSGD